jgi:hypothetical protein
MSSVNPTSSDPFSRLGVTTACHQPVELSMRAIGCGDNRIRVVETQTLPHTGAGFHR